MLIVISPAKNLDYDSALPYDLHSEPEYLHDAQILINQLKGLAPQDISDLMGISDKLGVLNYDRYQNWQQPFTSENARPAMFAFNGDVYTGLDAYSFNKNHAKFAQKHLRILSGLYGLLRPLDLMQPYRLEMGTAFPNVRGKNLYDFWKETITEGLNTQLKSVKSEFVVNLASNEYFKSVDKKQLDAEIITPAFKDWKNGQYKMISFFAKKARGLMSAYIIKNKITDADGILGFDLDGYAYNEAMSTDQIPVFTRKIQE